MNLVRQLIPKQWILEKRTWEWLVNFSPDSQAAKDFQFPIACVNNINVKRSRPICIREPKQTRKVAATRTRTKTPRNEEFNEGNNSCARAYYVFVHFFVVPCNNVTWLSSAYFGEHGSRLQGFYSLLNMTAIDTIMFSFILSLKRFRLYL